MITRAVAYHDVLIIESLRRDTASNCVNHYGCIYKFIVHSQFLLRYKLVYKRYSIASLDMANGRNNSDALCRWQVFRGQLVLILLTILATSASTPPTPPIWPEKFVASMLQNRSGSLALTTLVYDWPGGRNLNLVEEQLGGYIWDIEWTNGTSFIFNQTVSSFDLPPRRVHLLETSAA